MIKQVMVAFFWWNLEVLIEEFPTRGGTAMEDATWTVSLLSASDICNRRR